MEKYMNKGIKEVISQYPEIESILNEYNIGCAPCSVGTCLLKDIVEIHNLSGKEEQKLMTEIARVIYPGKNLKFPKIKKNREVRQTELKYSPPIKKLVDEHVLIKRLLVLIPKIIINPNIETKEGRKLIINSIDFIRSYADKYHHAKEEEILFKYFDENLDILKVIHEDHENGRAHVKAIIEALEKEDNKKVIEHLIGYKDLLTEHIKKEDEILYPWMDRNLTDSQIGKLFSQFSDVDKQFEDAPKKYENFITKLEKKFKSQEVSK